MIEKLRKYDRENCMQNTRAQKFLEISKIFFAIPYCLVTSVAVKPLDCPKGLPNFRESENSTYP